MCKKKSRKFKNYIIISLLILSLLLIIFGCLAPIIFTQCDSLVDFTNTGEIGDTIGGTMGPIVALAGVFMTFLAFFMQVEANKIQREQLGKSFGMRRLEDKIESLNALQLMSIDINSMIDNIDDIRKRIDDFCSATEYNPTGEVSFYFIPTKALSRYTSIDRNLVYNAFVNFIETDNFLEDFTRLYKHMDYCSESLDNFYPKVFKPHADEIMETKSEVLKVFKECPITFNSSIYTDIAIRSLHKKCYDQIKDCKKKDCTLDILKLYKTLTDERFNHVDIIETSEYKNLTAIIEVLISQNKNLSNDMCKVKDGLKAPYEDLKVLKEKIDNALSKNTKKSIQKFFLNQNNTDEDK